MAKRKTPFDFPQQCDVTGTQKAVELGMVLTGAAAALASISNHIVLCTNRNCEAGTVFWAMVSATSEALTAVVELHSERQPAAEGADTFPGEI